ncbi:glycosyltransferase [Flavobacteriaceae bacterium F08102]|nr:glycosyltransferase [Flavobacteriaceae bacterium F08102]
MKEIPTYLISASIVFYEENLVDLSRTVNSFLACPFPKKLFLIDNSPINNFEEKFKHPDIRYVFVGKNIGFGAGHNLVLERFNLQSDFHLVLNPDVCFAPTIFVPLLNEFESTPLLGVVAPRVMSPEGELQYTARRYPSPAELIARTVPGLRTMLKKMINKGRYAERNLQESFDPDFLEGCFLLFKTRVFIQLNGFDERYFLYMEDVDICRELDTMKLKKRYVPKVSIVHQHRRGSRRQTKLFFIHLKSAFTYFIKWGFSCKKTLS